MIWLVIYLAEGSLLCLKLRALTGHWLHAYECHLVCC